MLLPTAVVVFFATYFVQVFSEDCHLTDSDKSAIEDKYIARQKAILAKDYINVIEMYAIEADLVLGGITWKGKRDIAKLFREGPDVPIDGTNTEQREHYNWAKERSSISGDCIYAFEYGIMSLNSTKSSVTGFYNTVWMKKEDDWKVILEVNTIH